MNLLIPATLDLQLPAIRKIALELIQALNREDTEIAELAAIIRLDPVLTARVLAYANSPLLAALRPIADVQEAIIRMGRNEFRRVFYFSVLHDAFSAASAEHEAILRRLWTQSLAISVAAERLQMDLGHFFHLAEDEFAALATLAALQAVGFLALLHNFPHAFAQLFHPPAPHMTEFLNRQRQLFGGWDHALAGAMLLRSWCISDLSVRCTEGLLSPPSPEDHLAILLRLATYVAIQAGLTVFPDAPAEFWTQPLPPDLDPSALLECIPQVASTVEMYGGIWD